MDPMVRYPHDPAPLIPGSLHRFRWPRDSHDTEVIRREIQDRGRGLFVLEHARTVAGTPLKVLAEAYYGDEIRPGYFQNLDSARQEDARMGRLVIVAVLPLRGTFRVGKGLGSFPAYLWLTGDMIEEIRRNNRSARSDLKRQSSAVHRRQALEDIQRQKDERVLDEFAEDHVARDLEVLKYAVDPEHGGAIWRHNVRR